jgi:hypothetical protein
MRTAIETSVAVSFELNSSTLLVSIPIAVSSSYSMSVPT